VGRLKQQSLNPGAPVILGGAALLNADSNHPAQADGVALDARMAVALANRLVKN
jgi:hypothetical protein